MTKPQTTRFTPARKAAILNAIIESHITYAEAFAEYGISEEELSQWLLRVEQQGLRGLMATPYARMRKVERA